MPNMPWENLVEMPSLSFVCGYCGNMIASNRGYKGGGVAYRIHICPHCCNPTYFRSENQRWPGISPGKEVPHLPEKVCALYREARNCVSVGAHTSSVLTCRKLLMNIAVEQGASTGKKFIEYVEYLALQGYIPPNGRRWVDHIRKKGNEATHEINLMNQNDAEELIIFAEMLLRFIYEFPNRIPIDNS